MLDETTLAYGSISLYLWGVRQHMVLHRQADPIYGVPNWREFMSSILQYRCSVLAHAQAEPRRELPMDVIRLILEDTDDASFVDVNFAFFIVVLLFTFSRSETPCAKTFAGFDPAQHWQSKDIRWRCVDAVYCFAVRFKLIIKARGLLAVRRQTGGTRRTWETFQARSRCCGASKCSCIFSRRREMVKPRSSLLGIECAHTHMPQLWRI